jgi:hypothetical protein
MKSILALDTFRKYQYGDFSSVGLPESSLSLVHSPELLVALLFMTALSTPEKTVVSILRTFLTRCLGNIFYSLIVCTDGLNSPAEEVLRLKTGLQNNRCNVKMAII